MRTTWRIDWVNWPVQSQKVARRNAHRAAIICAQRRREREHVDRFLAELPGAAPGIPAQRRGAAH